MNRVFGVVTAKVVSVDDEQGEGRIQLTFPWLPGNTKSYWAPVASAMAGGDSGAWFMPDEGDEVLVAFNQGDVNHPYVVGFLWNGQAKPPSKDTRERMFQSKNKHVVRLLDSTPTNGNKGAITIEDAHGNKIVLCNGKLVLKSVGVLELQAPHITLQGPIPKDGGEPPWKRLVSPNNNPI
jgi:uncharacterized protein involved in type VI secretion and phage assembly